MPPPACLLPCSINPCPSQQGSLGLSQVAFSQHLDLFFLSPLCFSFHCFYFAASSPLNDPHPSTFLSYPGIPVGSRLVTVYQTLPATLTQDRQCHLSLLITFKADNITRLFQVVFPG